MSPTRSMRAMTTDSTQGQSVSSATGSSAASGGPNNSRSKLADTRFMAEVCTPRDKSGHSPVGYVRVSCRAFRTDPPQMPALLHPALPSSNSRQRWPQLYGSARSLALAEAVESDSRPSLVIARDARELDQ